MGLSLFGDSPDDWFSKQESPVPDVKPQCCFSRENTDDAINIIRKRVGTRVVVFQATFMAVFLLKHVYAPRLPLLVDRNLPCDNK